ncbi:hypothetical protein I3842_05G197500 [Carya illinoinensis]|uniref:Uncharacterized protein n=1 Tax=Carya illinoinensis TaxID=32201 RepID=A0A922JNF4_CARIL|nr:hypothetical protein I3842_05G197500 [Carya illinoinensis]KAG6714308.1 hypothetical protein I3842_05G197500 [Carya illinoinensis]
MMTDLFVACSVLGPGFIPLKCCFPFNKHGRLCFLRSNIDLSWMILISSELQQASIHYTQNSLKFLNIQRR